MSVHAAQHHCLTMLHCSYCTIPLSRCVSVQTVGKCSSQQTRERHIAVKAAHGKNRAHEKGPRLSPRPLKRNAGKVCVQTVARHSRLIVNMCLNLSVKHSTIVRYKELATRIYPAIRHLKLKDLRADHLNALYTALGKEGSTKGTAQATAKIDLAARLTKKGLTRAKLSADTGVSLRIVYASVKGEQVSAEAATAISAALDIKLDKAFAVKESQRTLSAKTVLEHHRLNFDCARSSCQIGACAVQCRNQSYVAKGSAERSQLLPAGRSGSNP